MQPRSRNSLLTQTPVPVNALRGKILYGWIQIVRKPEINGGKKKRRATKVDKVARCMRGCYAVLRRYVTGA